MIVSKCIVTSYSISMCSVCKITFLSIGKSLGVSPGISLGIPLELHFPVGKLSSMGFPFTCFCSFVGWPIFLGPSPCP